MNFKYEFIINQIVNHIKKNSAFVDEYFQVSRTNYLHGWKTVYLFCDDAIRKLCKSHKIQKNSLRISREASSRTQMTLL